jgi:hypothetical protein
MPLFWHWFWLLVHWLLVGLGVVLAVVVALVVVIMIWATIEQARWKGVLIAKTEHVRVIEKRAPYVANGVFDMMAGPETTYSAAFPGYTPALGDLDWLYPLLVAIDIYEDEDDELGTEVRFTTVVTKDVYEAAVVGGWVENPRYVASAAEAVRVASPA